jgi:hypothetical protein
MMGGAAKPSEAAEAAGSASKGLPGTWGGTSRPPNSGHDRTVPTQTPGSVIVDYLNLDILEQVATDEDVIVLPRER